jgi:uncharacterized protein YbjT (DUF2867 family)
MMSILKTNMWYVIFLIVAKGGLSMTTSNIKTIEHGHLAHSHQYDKKVLLTGATGYIGGLLLKRLLSLGYAPRCLVRTPENLMRRLENSKIEVVKGDLLDPKSIEQGLDGIHSAYYLVHSMGAGIQYSQLDKQAAEQFGQAAKRAGLQKIIYLGGLGSGPNLSKHLASRQEVGKILRESGVVTIEFRAGVVIGAGSLSFEMVRALVERLPVMVTPKWVRTPTQPIFVDDVLKYLQLALEQDFTQSQIFEIGCEHPSSYLDFMKEYSRQRGLRRIYIPVPVLTPKLSSLWLKLVTPLYAKVGRALIEGVRNPTIVSDQSARSAFAVRPVSMSQAISKAQKSSPLYKTETRMQAVSCRPEQAFDPIQRIGGVTGWYYLNWLWRLRAFLDRLIGGCGMRQGRPDPIEMSVGDRIDFWRVEEYVPKKLLRLEAEMKLPGKARLEFEVIPSKSGSLIKLTALFDPKGVFGRFYWYFVLPLHKLVFRGMLKRIAACAEVDQPDP